MKKRIITIVLAVTLLISALPSLSGFASAAGYSDVQATAWYYGSVTYASSNNIVGGRGGGVFDPGGTLSVAEAIKLACGIYANKNADKPLPEGAGSPWYAVYITYATENAIITKTPVNPDAAVTRAEFAKYIYAASGELEERNTIADGDIRDVAASAEYYDAVYSLYRVGVLTGSDKFGRFLPDKSLTRAEACEIVMRALVPTARKYVNLAEELASEMLFELCIGAVFSIETFDARGNSIRTGSGFFINADGLAATNLHVLDMAHSATVTLTNGSTYEVKGAVAYSIASNTALLQIDGSGFEWLPVASSDDVKTGQTVYSLGNPLGLDGTISKGIISYVGREVDEHTFLQFTSSISQGSGGGALVDSRGRVVGITSSSYSSGQTLNLATPSKHISELTPGKLTALKNVPQA